MLNSEQRDYLKRQQVEIQILFSRNYDEQNNIRRLFKTGSGSFELNFINACKFLQLKEIDPQQYKKIEKPVYQQKYKSMKKFQIEVNQQLYSLIQYDVGKNQFQAQNQILSLLEIAQYRLDIFPCFYHWALVDKFQETELWLTTDAEYKTIQEIMMEKTSAPNKFQLLTIILNALQSLKLLNYNLKIQTNFIYLENIYVMPFSFGTQIGIDEVMIFDFHELQQSKFGNNLSDDAFLVSIGGILDKLFITQVEPGLKEISNKVYIPSSIKSQLDSIVSQTVMGQKSEQCDINLLIETMKSCMDEFFRDKKGFEIIKEQIKEAQPNKPPINNIAFPEEILKQYQIIEQLHSSPQKQLYVIKDVKKGTVDFLKVKIAPISTKNRVMNEIKLIREFKDQSFLLKVRKFCVTEVNDTVNSFKVMDYYQYNLRKFMKKKMTQSQAVSQKEVLSLVQKITKAFLFLKHHQIYHQNLKPENIFVKTNSELDVVDILIGDFDRAVQSDSSFGIFHAQGYQRYCSPALIQSMDKQETQTQHDLEKSDVFSLGLCLLESFTGMDKKDIEKLDLNRTENRQILLQSVFDQWKFPYLNQIILLMLEFQETRRPGFAEVQKLAQELQGYDRLQDLEETKKINLNGVDETEVLNSANIFLQKILEKDVDKQITQQEANQNLYLASLLITPDEQQFEQSNQLKKGLQEQSQNLDLKDPNFGLACFIKSFEESRFNVSLNQDSLLETKNQLCQNLINSYQIYQQKSKVTFSGTQGVSFEDISQGTAKKEFQNRFIENVSQILGIHQQDIQLLGLQKGSIQVSFLIKVDGVLTSVPDEHKDELESGLIRLYGDENVKVKRCKYFKHLNISSDFIDTRGNYDFSDSQQVQVRGGHLYFQPFKAKRYGIQVQGLYESDEWLNMDNSEGEWAVAFHGTSDTIPKKVFKNNHQITSNNKEEFQHAKNLNEKNNKIYPTVGEGIYLSPHVEVCLNEQYSPPFQIEGQNFQVVFQCRVNPKTIRIAEKPSDIPSRSNDQMWQNDIWVATDSNDIRPYGILIYNLDDPIPQNQAYIISSQAKELLSKQ